MHSEGSFRRAVQQPSGCQRLVVPLLFWVHVLWCHVWPLFFQLFSLDHGTLLQFAFCSSCLRWAFMASYSFKTSALLSFNSSRRIFLSTSICLVCSVLTALHAILCFYIAEILKLMGKRWKTEPIQEAISLRPCNIEKNTCSLETTIKYNYMVHNTSPSPKS